MCGRESPSQGIRAEKVLSSLWLNTPVDSIPSAEMDSHYLYPLALDLLFITEGGELFLTVEALGRKLWGAERGERAVSAASRGQVRKQHVKAALALCKGCEEGREETFPLRLWAAGILSAQ